MASALVSVMKHMSARIAPGIPRNIGCKTLIPGAPRNNISVRWATKKAGGSTKNGRDSHSKRLGVKIFGGQAVIPGNIILRQRGTKFHPGEGVGLGRDHTIYAKKEGSVSFFFHKHLKYQTVSVI